jgi:sugar (pentulose or hexulose) kinase
MTGGFVGIVSGHGRAHLVRALLEGVAFQYPPTMQIVSAGGVIRTPIATGDGEARNALWNQIKADVLGVSLRVPRVVELAAVGAAILAGMAVGVFADAAVGVHRLVRRAESFEPDPKRHEFYESRRADYDRTYELIAPALRRTGA